MKRNVLRYWMVIWLFALLGGVPLMAQGYSPEFRVGVGGYYAQGGTGDPTDYEKDWVFYPEVLFATPVFQDNFWLKAGFGYSHSQNYYQSEYRYESEIGDNTSFKVSVGLERKFDTRIISFYYGIDLEYEKSDIDGVFHNDVYPFQQPIEYQKNSFIVQPYVGLRKVLWSQFVVFAETSLDFGFSKTKAIEVAAYYPVSESFSYVQFNPINVIGVGYILQ